MSKQNSAEMRLLASIRRQHDEIYGKLAERGAYRIACPHCGVSLLTEMEGHDALCPCCGTHLPCRRLLADKAVGHMHLAQTGMAELLESGRQALQREDWKTARQCYSQACSADLENGDAWYGLLLSVTERFSKMQTPCPDQIEAIAERTLDARGADLAARWREYCRQCTTYRQTQERLKREAEQARRQAKEDAKLKKKVAAQKRREERRQARDDPERKAARMNVLSIVLTVVGIGLFFVFAFLGAGFVFIFLLGGLGLFGGNRRRRR